MADQANGDSVIVRFLDHYQEFGSRGHLTAAQAMAAAIESTDDLPQRKLLAAKVYGELAAAIEDLSALCIAIRHRNDEAGLIYAYLTYGQQRNHYAPQTGLRQVFELLQHGDGLSTALREILKFYRKFACLAV